MKLMLSLTQKFQILRRHCKPNLSAGFASRSLSFEDSTGEVSQFEKCINEVKLLGRVGTDPHCISYQGKSGISFVLGTKKTESLGGSQLDWHTIFSYDPVVVKSVLGSVKKGMRVYVSGMLTSFVNDETTKKTGVRVFRLITF